MKVEEDDDHVNIDDGLQQTPASTAPYEHKICCWLFPVDDDHDGVDGDES